MPQTGENIPLRPFILQFESYYSMVRARNPMGRPGYLW